MTDFKTYKDNTFPLFANRIECLSQTDLIKDRIVDEQVELIAIPQLELKELGIVKLFDHLMQLKNFNWAINGSQNLIFKTLSDNLRIVTKDIEGLNDEKEIFLSKVNEIISLMNQIHSGKISFGLRNFFCPGDTILHLDNMSKGNPIRFLWAMNRPYGMKYTSRENIDFEKYKYFIQRELHLIRKMDAIVYNKNTDIYNVWAHREKQIERMKKEQHSYMKDPELLYQVPSGWSSIHLVDTPTSSGTFHCNTFSNEQNPGLQLLVTTSNT